MDLGPPPCCPLLNAFIIRPTASLSLHFAALSCFFHCLLPCLLNLLSALSLSRPPETLLTFCLFPGSLPTFFLPESCGQRERVANGYLDSPLPVSRTLPLSCDPETTLLGYYRGRGAAGGSEGVLPLPLAVSLLGNLTEGHWEVARKPWCNLRSETSVLFHLCLATLCFSSSTICLFPPLEALHLCPRPLSITLFIPLAPAPERKGRVLLPRKEGGAEQLLQEGKEKGGKEGSGQQKKVESGGRALHCLNFFPFQLRKVQPKAIPEPRFCCHLPEPMLGRPAWAWGTQVLVGMCKGGGQSSMCAADFKHLLHSCFRFLLLLFCPAFILPFPPHKKPQHRTMPQVRKRILNMF